jgi:transcriptional regulator with XRE-family HTH domain
MEQNTVDLKQIGQRLRQIRETLEMKQKALAEALTVSPATISEIEAGKNKPGFDVLFNLAERFNANPLFLLTGRGNMFIEDEIKGDTSIAERSEYTRFLKTFKHYFKHSSFVRHSIMAYFNALIVEKKDVIQNDLESEDSRPEE